MEQLKVDTFVPDSKETAIFYMVFVCRLYLNWIVIGRKRAVVFSLVSQSNLFFFGQNQLSTKKVLLCLR